MLLISLYNSHSAVYAQNLILNPSFELGTTPPSQASQTQNFTYATNWTNDCGKQKNCTTGSPMPGKPYLLDRNSPDCRIGVPTNYWASSLNERTNQNRYVVVGFGSLVGGACSTNDGIPYYGGTVTGTLTNAITDVCEYQVSFYAAAQQVHVPGGQSCGNFNSAPANPYDNKIQVVLRLANDCNSGKIVYTSPVITNSNWTKYQGTFSLTQSEASIGYNRIEFRRTPNPYKTTPDPFSSGIFIDDVNLAHGRTSIINSDFTLTATNPNGSNYNYLITATVNNIPTGSGFYWNVCEVDVFSGNVVPNTCLENPSSWWNQSLWYTNTFPGYCCNANTTTGNGTFLLGHKYSITRGTWGECSSWNQTTKTVYMDTENRIAISIDTASFLGEGFNIITSTFDNNVSFTSPSIDMTLSPNPTSGAVRIEYTSSPEVPYSDVDVFSLDGSHQMNVQFKGNSGVVDISKLTPGLYCFKVRNGNDVKSRIISLL